MRDYYKLHKIKNKIETNLKEFYREGEYLPIVMRHDKKYFYNLISTVKKILTSKFENS